MNAKTFYVYVLRDPRPGKNLQPIYVGKGDPNRARAHVHWYKGIKHGNPILRSIFSKLRKAGLEPQVEIIQHFDIEAEAFQLESRLIAQYGRRDLGTGTLCNFTNGGEGTSGSLATSAALKKLNADPEFAKASSKRASERMRKLHADPAFVAANAARLRRGRAEYHARPEVKLARAKARAEAIQKHREKKEANAERIRQRNADPEYKKAIAAHLAKYARERWDNPAYREAHAERMRRRNADPEFQKRARTGRKSESNEAAAEQMRQRNADPEYNAARIGALRKAFADPEYKKKHAGQRREAMGKLWATPESRARMSAGLRASWIKRKARAAFHPCAHCGKPFQPIRRTAIFHSKECRTAARHARRKAAQSSGAGKITSTVESVAIPSVSSK